MTLKENDCDEKNQQVLSSEGSLYIMEWKPRGQKGKSSIVEGKWK